MEPEILRRGKEFHERVQADWESKQVSGPGLATMQTSSRSPCWWNVHNDDELINHDKASLDIFWLRDESLEESDNIPAPDILAQEIVQDLEAALEQRTFRGEFRVAPSRSGNVLEMNWTMTRLYQFC